MNGLEPNPAFAYRARSGFRAGLFALMLVPLLAGPSLALDFDTRVLGDYVRSGAALDVAIEGEFAYVARGEFGGLDVLSLETPNPRLVGSCQAPGEARAVIVANQFAYVASGSEGLQIFDLTNPEAPRLAGHFRTGGYTEDLAISARYIFLANISVYDGTNHFGGGLHIIDVSDPAHPRPAGVYNPSARAHNVAVLGQRVYLTIRDGNGTGKVLILDIENPANPVELGAYHTIGTPNAVAVSEEQLYVAVFSWRDEHTGLHLVDVSDPVRPTQVARYPNIDGVGIALAENRALVATRRSLSGTNVFQGGLHIIDLTNPSAPAFAGAYQGRDSMNLAVSDSSALLAQGDSITVIDLRDSARPRLTGGYITSSASHDLALFGGYAYLAGPAGLQVLELGNSSNPKPVGTWLTHGYTHSVTVCGSYALVLTESALQILDITTPAVPRILGEYAVEGFKVAAGSDCTRAYVLSYGQLHILDISDPAQPQALGFFDLPDGGDIAVKGTYVYVARSGIAVLDVQDAANPVLVGEFQLPAEPNPDPFFGGGYHRSSSVVVSNDYAYLSGTFYDQCGGHGCQVQLATLDIVEVSNPAEPVQVGHFETPGLASHMTVDDHYAYLSVYCLAFGWDCGVGTLHAVDLTDLANPKRVFNHSYARLKCSASLAGQILLAGEGVEIVAPFPANPQSERGLSGSLEGAELALLEDRALITDYSGFRTVQLGSPGPLEWQPVVVTGEYGPRGVTACGAYAFLAQGTVMQTVQLQDDAPAIVLGSFTNNSGEIFEKIVSNGDCSRLYPLLYNGFLVLDSSDSAHIKSLGRYRTESSRDISVQGERAVLCRGDNGFEVVDISDPTGPRLVGTYTSSHFPRCVALTERYACLMVEICSWTCNESMLEIIDLNNPGQPVQTGAIKIEGLATDVAVRGSYVYIAANGVQVVDIRDPTSPRHVGANRSIFPSTLLATDGRIYAVGTEGFFVLHEYQPVRILGVGLQSTTALRLQIGGPPRVPGMLQRSRNLREWSDWLPVDFGEEVVQVLDADRDAYKFYRVAIE